MADTRAALGRADIVLADTGAVKMWMARLYPTYQPNTCLTSNGLSAMAFALPGAIGAKPAEPGRRVLAAAGDGAFLMNSQEIETALRERIPLTVLIWQDDAYGLIRWKMDLELGHDVATGFSNPGFAAYAESFGARGYARGRRPRPSGARSSRQGRPYDWMTRTASTIAAPRSSGFWRHLGGCRSACGSEQGEETAGENE